MATHAAETSSHEHGQMDVAEHTATFRSVMAMFKWGSLHTAVILVFLTMWFCAHTGFIAALVTSLILMVLGIVFLRAKPKPGH